MTSSPGSFGARANVEFDRRAGGIEADTVPDPERSATVDAKSGPQPTARSLAPCSGGVQREINVAELFIAKGAKG